jgi:hypothetical protein
MFERFFGFIGRIDRCVGPIYRILFVAGAVVAAVTWLVYQALPIATEVYNWIDGRITDIGPLVITPQGTTRLLISFSTGLSGGLVAILAEFRKVQELRVCPERSCWIA